MISKLLHTLRYQKNVERIRIIIIINDGQLCFLWCILAHLHPVDDQKNRSSKHVIQMPFLCVEGLEFPMKVNGTPEFETLNNLNRIVIEGTVLTPIHVITNYDQPQIHLSL